MIHVIDDEEALASLTKELIEARIIDTNTGRPKNVCVYLNPELLLSARLLPRDIYIVDLLMPRINGLTLITHLIKSKSVSPANILVTSGNTDLFRCELEKLGITQFFDKPLSYRNLIQTITLICKDCKLAK